MIHDRETNRRPERSILLAASVCAVLSVIRHLPLATQPSTLERGGFNGAVTIGAPLRSYERLGFRAIEGRPFMAVIPTTPPTGQLYLNHPPLVP